MVQNTVDIGTLLLQESLDDGVDGLERARREREDLVNIMKALAVAGVMVTGCLTLDYGSDLSESYLERCPASDIVASSSGHVSALYDHEDRSGVPLSARFLLRKAYVDQFIARYGTDMVVKGGYYTVPNIDGIDYPDPFIPDSGIRIPDPLDEDEGISLLRAKEQLPDNYASRNNPGQLMGWKHQSNPAGNNAQRAQKASHNR